MDDKPEQLADRLLNAEPMDAGRLMSIRTEMTAMIEQKWSRTKRIGSALVGALLIFLAVGVSASVIARGDKEASLIRTVVAVSMVVCVALGVLMIWLGWRGVFHRRRHNQMFLLMAVLILGGMALVFLNEGWATDNARFQFIGQLMLALLGFTLVLHFVEQSQIATTYRLLELEYQIRQMNERLDTSRGRPGDGA